MKFLVVFAFIGLVMAEEYYRTGNDYLDVDAFFADVPKSKAFLDCYMDRGECPDLAASYKKIIPEAVVLACRKCNDPQKHIFYKFLQGLKALYPKEYQGFRQKYDPESKYFDALEKELSKY